MAGWSLLCGLVAVCAVVGAGISGKGFYCRDPDNGKLYPVNSTWLSNTFCGSYTCKLRRKNTTEINNTNLLRRFNISNNTENGNQNTINVENEKKQPLLGVETYSDVILNEENVRNIIKQRIKNNDKTHDGDRYLTEAEIKSLTDLLHSVKKSDLEAIIEMYNLAQDVYKEIDTVTDENLIEETIKDLKDYKDKSHNENEIEVEYGKKHTSYWYEPLSGTLHKHKHVEAGASKETLQAYNDLNININPEDMEHDGSNIAPVVAPTNSMPYFAGSLTSNDFRKLPYYYPMSSFQRLSSYYHPQNYLYLGNNMPQQIMVIPTVPAQVAAQNSMPQNVQSNKITTPQKTNQQEINQKSVTQNSILNNIIQQITPIDTQRKKPCKHTLNNLKYLHVQPSWVNRIVKKPFNVDSQKKRFQDETELLSRPLPVAENESDDVWKFLDLYNKRYNNQIPGYVSAAYIARMPHAVLVNSDLVKEKIDAKSTGTTDKMDKMPDWQTSPLSKSVLDEVKANVESKPKLFPSPLRKRVKLERVGKVIKLEEFVRPKREASYTEGTDDKEAAEMADLYEVYVDKSLCDSDTEPGFFRVGNLTEPYPACCPQRIGKNR